MTDANKFFIKDLENYWHCEVRDESSGKDLLRALGHSSHPISEQQFKHALRGAIANLSIDVKQYERITGLDFAHESEVAKDLELLYHFMYGGVSK